MATYVTENKIVAGRLQAIYKAPQFIKGYCVVKGADEPGLYERMMRSKMCVSNKYRRPMGATGKTKDLYVLVEDKKEINDQLMLTDLRLDAQIMIKQGDWIKLKAIAEKLNTSPDVRHHIKSYRPGDTKDLQGMKLELMNVAQMYPKAVIVCSDDAKAILTVQVMEALNFGVLIFDKDAYWIMDTVKGLKKVYQPAPDEDHKESLIAYLMSEKGEKDYVLLGIELEKALGVKS